MTRFLVGCLLLALAGPSLVLASRFEPLDGRILVLVGQSPAATMAYTTLPNTPNPAGFSDYVIYDVGAAYRDYAPDAPQTFKGNDGLLLPANWGSGIQCANCLLTEPGFEKAVINIGLYLAGPQASDGSMCRGRDDCAIARLARGEFDEQLQVFAHWLNSLGERPVLLRPGYEFDGQWNNYDPNQFKAAWKYLHRFLRTAGVSNVAFVLHTSGFASRKVLDEFWPAADSDADHYVDWIGYSYFQMDSTSVGEAERELARERGLKVFLGEVAPHTGDCTRQIDFAKDTELGRQWIEKFFAHVENHRDVIRALAYINDEWSNTDIAPMWQDQQDQNCGGFFSRSNSRLNDNPVLEALWGSRVSGKLYLNGEKELYDQLQMEGVQQ